MSFHKRHVPAVEVLKEQLEREGIDAFVRTYTKPDALIGSRESMDFVDSIVKQSIANDNNHKSAE
jgi:hypothetical protein